MLHVCLAFNGQSWSFWSERGSKRSSIYIYTRFEQLLTIPRFISGSPTAIHAAVSPSTRRLMHRRRRGLKSSHQTPFSSMGSHREGSHSFAYLISFRCVSIYMLKCSQCALLAPLLQSFLTFLSILYDYGLERSTGGRASGEKPKP